MDSRRMHRRPPERAGTSAVWNLNTSSDRTEPEKQGMGQAGLGVSSRANLLHAGSALQVRPLFLEEVVGRKPQGHPEGYTESPGLKGPSGALVGC